MNDKFVNRVFKIGVLLIGMAFLVVYFFHSQNGRFLKIGDRAIGKEILDTRTGIVYIPSASGPIKFFSINITNGKIKIYDADISGGQIVPAGPAPAPASDIFDKISPPSAQDFLKGKK